MPKGSKPKPEKAAPKGAYGGMKGKGSMKGGTKKGCK